MKSKFLQWFAIVITLEIGLLHLMTAQAEFEEVAYMGYLFVGNFVGALLAAYGIYRKQLWGWILGLFIAIGSIAGYAWSRTSGMPGMEVEEWFTPYGTVAMAVEFIFVLLFILRPWKIPDGELIPSTAQRPLRYILPVTGLLILGLISAFTFRWDTTVTQAFGYHVVSLDQVIDTPEISFSQLEEQYGMQVSLVAASMMNSIVDVRLKIIDPDKAHLLLQNQTALLVNQQSLVLAPHMHAHDGNRLKVGKVFIIFFPTQQVIHAGTEVSLVFGRARVEPVIVR
jgi:hypothetical protein